MMMGMRTGRLKRLGGFSLWVTLVLVIVLSAFSAYAKESPKLKNVDFIGSFQPAMAVTSSAADQAEQVWAFEALGKRFEMDLSSNAKLVASLPQAQRDRILATSTFLRGRLRGNDDSWVRLTKTARGTSGMIWDGQTLYVIEPAMRVQMRLSLDQPLASDDDRLVVYRYDDQEQTPLACGSSAHNISGGGYKDMTSEMEANTGQITAMAQNGELRVVLVEDQHWNGNSHEIFNAVDGIYQKHFGISVAIASQEQATLNPSSGSRLLSSFSQYIGNRSSVGVAHLMSGRKDTGWAGIAFLSQLCNHMSHGVSAYYGFATTVCITAHELGHNCGAKHDTDVGCGNQYLMNPYVNGSNTFSSCSINAMSQKLARSACVTSHTEKDKAEMQQPAPGSTLNASQATFTWSRPQGVTQFDLDIGTSGAGSSDVFATEPINRTSLTVNSLPIDGRTLYVRLWTYDNEWLYNDYTYETERPSGNDKAEIQSPVPGSTLSTSQVTFTWSSPDGARYYNLYIGTNGAGSSDVLARSVSNQTSLTVNNLPIDGRTLYVRIWTYGNEWLYNDYTYETERQSSNGPDSDGDGDVDGVDLSELSTRIQNDDVPDVSGATQAFAEEYGSVQD